MGAPVRLTILSVALAVAAALMPAPAAGQSVDLLGNPMDDLGQVGATLQDAAHQLVVGSSGPEQLAPFLPEQGPATVDILPNRNCSARALAYDRHDPQPDTEQPCIDDVEPPHVDPPEIGGAPAPPAPEDPEEAVIPPPAEANGTMPVPPSEIPFEEPDTAGGSEPVVEKEPAAEPHPLATTPELPTDREGATSQRAHGGAGHIAGHAPQLPGIVVLAGGFALWRIGAFLVPLFSRLKGHHAREQQVRAEMLRLVRSQPGIHVAEIARCLDLNESHARYHLDVLERFQLVRKEKVQRYACYFSAGEPDISPVLGAVGLLKAERARRVLAFAAAHPGTSVAALEREDGLPRGAFDYHVRRLAAAGLLDVRRDGKVRRLFVAGGGRLAFRPGWTTAGAALPGGTSADPAWIQENPT